MRDEAYKALLEHTAGDSSPMQVRAALRTALYPTGLYGYVVLQTSLELVKAGKIVIETIWYRRKPSSSVPLKGH